jgi:hypothetical protein
VEMTDVVSERDCYTEHGQHLNLRSKENMSKKTAVTTEGLQHNVDPISVKW